MNQPGEPTSEECDNHTEIAPGQFAIWYPQMGGYGGHAVVEVWPTESNECFNVWLWHDGEFPFSEGQAGVSPAHLHHCAAAQFVLFGHTVDGFQKLVTDRDQGLVVES